MTLHITTGSSTAAQLDAVLAPADDILLLENARIWNQHEAKNLDPVEHTAALQRQVLLGRPKAGRAFQVPRKFSDIDAVSKRAPVCIWLARNVDDVMLSLWIFNHLEAGGFPAASISFVTAFCTVRGDPVSSVEQLSDADIRRLATEPRKLGPHEITIFRDRWASLTASQPQDFEKAFAFDYAALKGWQDVLVSIVQRVPSVSWGHAPEVVVLFECLRVAKWEETKAFVQYVTQMPFSPSKLREPDAKAILRAILAELDRIGFKVDKLEDVATVLRAANSGISKFCVPFFWRDALKTALPAGTGARVLM